MRSGKTIWKEPEQSISPDRFHRNKVTKLVYMTCHLKLILDLFKWYLQWHAQLEPGIGVYCFA